MEAVQIKIEECEQRVKKYSQELIVDAESMKTTIRNYVSTYFDEAESQRESMAKLIVFLTESALLEQGIASQVMKAEMIK